MVALVLSAAVATAIVNKVQLAVMLLVVKPLIPVLFLPSSTRTLLSLACSLSDNRVRGLVPGARPRLFYSVFNTTSIGWCAWTVVFPVLVLPAESFAVAV